MIGSLRGTVLERTARGANAEVIIEVGGVGYRVLVTPATATKLPERETAFVYVHTHVREDALVLYGFANRDERICFEQLLTTHGVGTGLALAILSSLTPGALRTAVASDDADALTTVPGVGKKTALRLLIELKSKLSAGDLELDGVTGPTDAPIVGRERADVREALSTLGYGAEEIRSVLRQLPADGTTQQLLRQALALIGAP